MYRLASSTPRGWAYGLVAVDGVLKCGWVEEGTIRTLKAPPIARICDRYEAPLKHPSTHFRKVNCPPGECTGPEWLKLSATCDDRVFANFATATASALNVLPNRLNSGFSLYIGAQTNHIWWRGDFLKTSKEGAASDVMSDELHAWGMMSTQCTEEAEYSETQVVWHLRKE